MILAAILEAVLDVSSKAQWHSAVFAPSLSLVSTVDRRTDALSFVGKDRRLVEEAQAQHTALHTASGG